MKDLTSKVVLLVVIGFSSLTYSAMPVATAVLDGVSFDTTVATNDTITLGRNELSITLPYSSSMWNEIDPSGGVARITVYDESVFETEASEGVFNWTPLCAGFYRLSLTVGSVNYQKFVQFMAPTVCFAREGYSSCKLTASDGVSPIRYTTDGSDPTESSALYTGPFEISPSKWTTVKARTFGEGYLPGEICSEVFGKAGSVVSRAETTTAIDNTAGVRNIPCEAHALMYDVTWEGHESSRVAFSADGEMFVERTGAGEVEWMPTHEGLTTLSLKTLNESGTQEGEYTATFYVWPSEIVVTNGLLPLKEQLTGGIDALRSVVVSRDMTELCADFFDGCTGLKSVTLPLAILGDSVGMADLFPDSYTAITNVVLTGEGERIPPGAFAGCASLQNVVIPKSVTGIGTGAFNGCVAMADDDGFLVIQGVLYGYFGDDNCVSIPDGVAAIDPKAFYGNTVLAEVIIPSTVVRIGSEAFAGCTSLTRVVIPSSVTEIGNNAFSGCNLIKDATLPGWKCGINFSNVTNLVIAGGTTNIANYAFQSCYSLESVTLPDSVTHIGYSAFSYCSNLKRVEIPDSVIAIGSYAFGSCNSELYDTASIPGIKLVDGWAIEVDKSKLPSNLDLTGIRGICGSVFQNCTSLRRVVIPDCVKGIGDSAFYGCEALAEVSLPDGLTGCDIKSAFSETPFIISDTFPEFILSRSGKTLYGINAKFYDSSKDWDYVWDEMKCVDILVPDTVQYVMDYALGALSAYIYDPDWGEYYENDFTSGQDSVIFMGSKPSASEKAFMYPGSEDNIARDEVYYYEGNDGWTWNGDWCGVKTYPLPNIPNEYKAASDCTFGRTYGGGWWKDEWMRDGKLIRFTEYELWYNNDAGLYGDEFAFFPVTTAKSSIKPYILFDDTPEKYLDDAEVWTDAKMFGKFVPKNTSVSHWDGDDDDRYEYKYEDEYWHWPKNLWPDNKAVSDRKWIVVPLKEVKKKWSGVSSFRVGVFGTSAISDPVLVVSDEDNAIFTKDFVSGFHGMTIDGVEYLESDGSTSWDDTIITEYEFVNWSQFVNNLPISFTITVPSAGTLVMGCKDDEDDSIAQAFSITGSGILSDRVTEMSDDWDDLNYKWGITNFYKTGEADYVRRVKVSKGTTLTFTRNNFEDLECEFTRINFFPQDSKSVAINVAYVCEEEMNGMLGNEYWGRHYLKGYVKESGVYKKGVTATFEAVGGEGEVFDHWEVCFGPLNLTESQRTSPRLSFVVTDEMCGDMADEAQIFLRAVWKPKYKITALPSIVGAGKVEGSGRYFKGDKVTLKAKANRGYQFVRWSDGVKDATRIIEVVAGNVERVIFAYFKDLNSDGGSDIEPEPTPTPTPEPEPTPTPVPNPSKPELGNGNYDVAGDELAGTVPEKAASVYDGYLYLDNVVMGTIQAKVSKPKLNKKLGVTTAKTSVAIQLTGEKKITLKGELDLDIGEFIATDKKSGRVLILKFGSKGISGSFGKYDIDGARNFFDSKDKGEKSAAEEILKPYLGAYSMICDGGILSVTIAKKGKVTVKGTYNGEKVSAKAQALIGEEMICIPVIYSKKSVNLAFTIWLPIDGGNAEIIGLDDAVIGKAGTLKNGAKFIIDDDIGDFIETEDERTLELLPNGEIVTVSGSKWLVADGIKPAKVAYKKGEFTITEGRKGAGIANPSGLKLTYKSKDGSFKGSFTAYGIVNGKLKKHKASVEGVLVNGVGYGTITIKKIGTWAVTIE